MVLGIWKKIEDWVSDMCGDKSMVVGCKTNKSQSCASLPARSDIGINRPTTTTKGKTTTGKNNNHNRNNELPRLIWFAQKQEQQPQQQQQTTTTITTTTGTTLQRASPPYITRLYAFLFFVLSPFFAFCIFVIFTLGPKLGLLSTFQSHLWSGLESPRIETHCNENFIFVSLFCICIICILYLSLK